MVNTVHYSTGPSLQPHGREEGGGEALTQMWEVATGCAGARTVPDIRHRDREGKNNLLGGQELYCPLATNSSSSAQGGLKIVYRSQVSIMTVPANPTLSVNGKHVTCALSDSPMIPFYSPSALTACHAWQIQPCAICMFLENVISL